MAGVRWTPGEAAALAAIAVVGFTLRLWHLDGPSLWWDELVHLGIAQQPDVSEVVRLVRLGSPPGSGNAGAVPLDYLLLHFWQRVVPFPDPRHLEAYFRFPACLFSAATPVALHLWARRLVGPTTGLIAAAFIALSTWHVAYAVEARFYALFTLMTVANLAVFSWLAVSRRPLAWAAFSMVAVLHFFTGLFGLLIVAVEYVALAVGIAHRWRRRGTAPRAWRPSEAAFLFGSAAVTTLTVLRYYAETNLRATSRVKRPPMTMLDVTLEGLWQYASQSVVLATLLGVGVCVIAWRTARGRMPSLIGAMLLTLLVAMLPAIGLIEQQKQYYFHVRHGLFLLPVVGLAVAIGATTALEWLGLRKGPVAMLGIVLLLGLQGPAVARYVRQPESTLWRTKALTDMSGLVDELSVRIESLRRSEKILLVGQRHGPGALQNAVLARYLRWWGLTDKVVFRSIPDVGTGLQRFAKACGPSCRGRVGLGLQAEIGIIRPPLVLSVDALDLLNLRGHLGSWPGYVGGVVLLSYSNHPRSPVTNGFERRPLRGIVAWQMPGNRVLR